MPLDQGTSNATVSRTVEELIKAGHSREKAIALAESAAGKSTCPKASKPKKSAKKK